MWYIQTVYTYSIYNVYMQCIYCIYIEYNGMQSLKKDLVTCDNMDKSGEHYVK